MDLMEIRDFALSLPLAEETTPFDEVTLVYKVMGKMFLMVDIEHPDVIAVKCDPAMATELRDLYEEVTPAYHMNKVHWNNVRTDGDLPADFIRSMIRDSYDLVTKKTQKRR